MAAGRLQLFQEAGLAVGRHGSAVQAPATRIFRDPLVDRVRKQAQRKVFLRRAAVLVLVVCAGVLTISTARAEESFSGREFLRESGISKVEGRRSWSTRSQQIYKELKDDRESAFDCRRVTGSDRDGRRDGSGVYRCHREGELRSY